jgi:hypothetical protein
VNFHKVLEDHHKSALAVERSFNAIAFFFDEERINGSGFLESTKN